MLDKMSNENRLQTESLLKDLNQTLLQEVGDSRGISMEQIAEISSRCSSGKTKMLLNTKWSMDYGTNQVINLLKEKIGIRRG